jgi:hypothetical protein
MVVSEDEVVGLESLKQALPRYVHYGGMLCHIAEVPPGPHLLDLKAEDNYKML